MVFFDLDQKLEDLSPSNILDAIRNVATPQFLVGVALMLCGTLLQNIGLGLQKLAHVREAQKPLDEQHPYWKNKSWWLALVMFISGAILDFCSLALLPASVALPLGGVGLAASSIFASKYLGEVFTTRDKLGTLFIILGSWSAVLFARKTDVLINSNALLSRLDITKASGIYIMFVVAIQTSLMALHKYRYRNAVMASIIPGSLGAFGNIGGKGTAELLKMTIVGENQFTHPFTYCFIAFTAAMLIWQNDWLQRALANYDQVIVVPTYYVAVCMFSVLGGVFFFGEWERTSPWQDLLFTCGVMIIFLGVWFLTKDHLKPEYLLARENDPDAEPPPLMLSSMAFEDADEEDFPDVVIDGVDGDKASPRMRGLAQGLGSGGEGNSGSMTPADREKMKMDKFPLRSLEPTEDDLLADIENL